MRIEKELLGRILISLAIVIASYIVGQAIIEAAGIIGSQIASAIAIT